MFGNCTRLHEVILPDRVMEIGREAFSGCVSLVTLRLPTRLLLIEVKAFAGCTELTTLVMPAGLMKIGIEAFSGCVKLCDVTFRNTYGWRADALSVLADELGNTYTAATYLNNRYLHRVWTCY